MKISDKTKNCFTVFYPASRIAFNLPRKIKSDSARRVAVFMTELSSSNANLMQGNVLYFYH